MENIDTFSKFIYRSFGLCILRTKTPFLNKNINQKIKDKINRNINVL